MTKVKEEFEPYKSISTVPERVEKEYTLPSPRIPTYLARLPPQISPPKSNHPPPSHSHRRRKIEAKRWPARAPPPAGRVVAVAAAGRATGTAAAAATATTPSAPSATAASSHASSSTPTPRATPSGSPAPATGSATVCTTPQPAKRKAFHSSVITAPPMVVGRALCFDWHP